MELNISPKLSSLSQLDFTMLFSACCKLALVSVLPCISNIHLHVKFGHVRSIKSSLEHI